MRGVLDYRGPPGVCPGTPPQGAGPTLVELVLAGRITVDPDGSVSVTDPAPVGHPSLDTALTDIVGWNKPGKVTAWIQHLKKDAVAAAGQGLLDKGLVREETKKVLGFFPVRRYPEADGSVEAAVRARLDAAVLHDGSPDARTAGLIALLHGAKLAPLAFPDADRSQVESRMAVLAQGQWAAPAVRQAIEATRQALTAIVTTTVVTSVIAGS
ncbi:GPP34 family phosphoprotein [Streptomyces sp. NPDC000594]|uniref:GOLPH3/VPS74 family protein n=1 Tax=Streptomyces sp. NPDC000594 TaxID=3154261 RepID=UPI00331E2943